MKVRMARPEEKPKIHDVDGYVELLLDEDSPLIENPTLLGRVVLEIIRSYPAVLVSWRENR